MSRSCLTKLLLLAILAVALYGQAEMATITGVITDIGGSLIQEAQVVVRNTDTNVAQSMSTNGVGSYTITSLPPGPYVLTASKAGFQIYKQTSIVLQVGQVLRNDVKMQVGNAAQTITVEADIAPLNTENGSIKGDVISHAEIENMPLNGRDVTSLALLFPGVAVAPGGARYGSFAAVNGTRSDSTNYYVDGVMNLNTRGFGGIYTPNLDAMQEFRMETSGYSAEFGKMAGGVLNMVLRSGTNQFHGLAFEYFRNSVFDSRGYFDTQNLGLHQNQFGGTFAGPVVIPKLYNGRDHAFFFFSIESYRLRWGQTALGNVPTALERIGNFSQTATASGAPLTIVNPFAGNAPFVGNIIPTSMLSPVAVKLMQYYPLPNRAALGNNFFTSAINMENWDSPLFKIDFVLSPADHLSFNFAKRFDSQNAPFAGSNLGVFQNKYSTDNESGGLTLTHVFKPNFLGEFRFGLSRQFGVQNMVTDGTDTAAAIGMEGSTHDPFLRGLPAITITNYLTLGYANNQPAVFADTNWQGRGNFTLVKAHHLIKFGLDYARYQINQPFLNNVRGSMTANGVWTGGGTAAKGNALADAMLGLLSNSTLTTLPGQNYMRSQGTGVFINDDWKITRRLTVNLGLRYEIETPAHDEYDRMSNFVPSLGKIVVAGTQGIPNFNQVVAAAGLTGVTVNASDVGLPRSLVDTYYKATAPRFGIAWSPLGNDHLVVRAGYGIFYGGYALNDIRIGLDDTFPFVQKLSYARNSKDPTALTLADPFNTALGTLTGTNSVSGFQTDAPIGYIQSYNFTVEWAIGNGNVIEAGLVGTKGTHLGEQVNLNFPNRTQAFFLANNGSTNFPAPYPSFSTINYWGFGDNSTYTAGQITLRRRFSSGLFYNLNYTYGKSLDTASELTASPPSNFSGALDPFNLALDRGRSDFDRRHVFNTVFSWLLPVGRGKRFLTNANGLVNGVLGGWQLAGMSALYSGRPFTVNDSTANVAIGESARPDRIASGEYVGGKGRRGIDYPWYNPNAFVAVPTCVQTPKPSCAPDQYGFQPFAFGNSGRNILDAPGMVNMNMSLMKNFQVGESKSLQFRWEVFNVLNHPNFTIDSASVTSFNQTTAGYLVDIAATGQGGPRIMQLALRFSF